MDFVVMSMHPRNQMIIKIRYICNNIYLIDKTIIISLKPPTSPESGKSVPTHFNETTVNCIKYSGCTCKFLTLFHYSLE